jgi:hypothetical protein
MNATQVILGVNTNLGGRPALETVVPHRTGIVWLRGGTKSHDHLIRVRTPLKHNRSSLKTAAADLTVRYLIQSSRPFQRSLLVSNRGRSISLKIRGAPRILDVRARIPGLLV